MYNDIIQYELKHSPRRNNHPPTKLNQRNDENVSPILSTIVNYMISIASVTLLDMLCKCIRCHKQEPFV